MSYRKHIQDAEDCEYFCTWLSYHGYRNKKAVDENWNAKELETGRVLARVVKKFDTHNFHVSENLAKKANFEEFSKLCKKHKLTVLWDPKKAYYGDKVEIDLVLQNLIELCLSTKLKESEENSGLLSRVKAGIGSGFRKLTSTVSTILESGDEWSDMIEHLQQCQQGRALDLHIINRGIKCVDGRLDYLFDGTKGPSSTAGRYCLELWQSIENMPRGPLICYLLLKAQVYLGCSNRREEYDSTFLTLLQWLCHNPRLIAEIPFTDVFQQLQKLRAKLTPETDFIVTIICMTHETLTTNTNTKAKEMWYNFQLGRRRVDYRLVFTEVPSFARMHIDIFAPNMFPKLQVLPDQVPDLFYQLSAFREILSGVNLENLAERLATDHMTEDNFSSSIAPISALCAQNYSLMEKCAKKMFEQHYAKKSFVESVFSTFSGLDSSLCRSIMDCYVSAFKDNIRKMRVDQFMFGYTLLPERNVLLVQDFIQHTILTSNELKGVVESYLCVDDSISSPDRMKSILTTLISKSKDYTDSFLFIPLHCTEYSKMFEPFENILLEINNHLREFFKQHQNGFNQMFTKICSIKREEKEFGRLFYLLINSFLGVYFETQMTGGSSLHNLMNIMGILEKVQSRSSVHLIVFNSALMACSKHIRNLRSEPYVYIRTGKGIAPFISTWKNTKSNDKSLIAQQYNNAFEQYIRSIYAELIEDVTTMDGELLQIEELLQLRKNLPQVVELCNAIGINSRFDGQVKDLHNELQVAERTHKGLSTLLNWLREHKFGTLREISNSPLKPIENTKTSLCDLREMIQETEQRLAAISETKDDLLYFIERESLLFQAVLRTKLSNRETSLRTLNSCIRETVSFISALFDNDQMTIKSLEDVNIDRVIRNIRQAKRTLESELSIIKERFSKGSVKVFNIDKFAAALKLKELSTQLTALLDALTQYNMDCHKTEQVKLIKEKYDRLQTLQDTKLGDVPTILEEFEKLLCGMHSFHMKYFEQLCQSDCKQLVEFLKNQTDFAKQMDILRGKAGKDKFQENVLNALLVAKTYLEPFLHKDTSLASIAEKVNSLGNEEEIDFKLEAIKTCASNLSHIKLWLSRSSRISIEDTYQTIEQLQKLGKWRSALNNYKDGAFLTIEYTLQENTQILAEDELNDLVRTAIFHSTDVKGQELVKSKITFHNFIESNKYASKAHFLRLALESAGHPDYQGTFEYLGEKLDSTTVKQVHDLLSKELDEWESCIQQQYQQERAILKLSRTQYIRFLGLVREVCADVTNANKEILTPFFNALFPKENIDLSNELVVELFDELKRNNAQRLDFSEAVALIQLVRQRLGIQEGEDDSEENHPTIVLKAEQLAPVDLLCHTLERIEMIDNDYTSNRFVEPGQLLWCSETTSIQELRWFDERRKAFADVNYVIIGVDKLSSSVREELIKLEADKSRSGKTHLIFNSVTGLDAFSFLDQEILDSFQQNQQYRTWLMDNLSQYANIKKISCVNGDDASGKSTWIRKRIVSEGGDYVRIVAAEDFSTKVFLNRLKSAQQGSKLGVHLDISQFVDLDQLNAFFFNIFLQGLLIDSATGSTELLPQCEISVYCELPNHNIKEFIPLLSLLVPSSTTIKNVPFDVTEEDHEAKLVATFIAINDNNHWEVYDDLSGLDVLPAEDCQRIIRSFFENNAIIAPTMVHRTLFVRLMYSRCKFLMERTLIRQELQQEYYEPIDPYENGAMFGVFLLECQYMANDKIKQDWSQLSVAFSARSLEHCDFLYMGESDPIAYIPENSIKRDSLAQVRAALTSALGLGGSLIAIMEKFGYCLTVDFAVKLLLLNERKSAKLPVILQGSTGTGKTELLRLYAEIQNQKAKLKPDIVFEVHLRWFLQQYVAGTESFQLYKNCYDKYVQENGVRSNKTLDEQIKQYNPAVLRRYLTEQLEQDEDYCRTFGLALIAKAKSLLVQYPLLELTPFTKSILQASDEEAVESLGTTTSMMKFMEEFLNLRVGGVFHKITMHNGWTCKQLRDRMHSIITETQTNVEKYPEFSTVVFIDELNTSKCLGILKEMFIDNTLDGVQLPSNIFLVGAINPAKSDDKPDEEDRPEYYVEHMPGSMDLLILDYAELSQRQEREFLTELVSAKNVSSNEKEQKQIVEAILWSQKFVHDQHLWRVRVSIRDMVRAITIYQYLTTTNPLKLIRNHHIFNLYTAIALTYYFRLPTDRRILFNRGFQANVVKTSNSMDFVFQDVLSEVLDQFYVRLKNLQYIPIGIAKTQAFKENLFCCIICIQSGIPLIITGPPGTSKTLSFNIASTTKNNSTEKLFDAMRTVHKKHYQCNEASTAQEISNVFKTQINMKRSFEKAGMLSEVCAVFLDEAGLPQQKKAAMKVIHYYLDHPEVSAVIISNDMLDAAKTNRAIQLCQSDTKREDLKALCLGCLMLENECTDKQTQTIEALCESFEQVNKQLSASKKGGLFHLRDFVYFLRMLKRNQKRYNNDVLHRDNIYYCLQRNFSGVPSADFSNILKLFFECINKRLGTRDPIPEQKQSYLQIIRDSINDRLMPEENPNGAPFRYVLILDPSDCGSAINLLFSEKFIDAKNTQVVCVSNFPDDNNELSQSAVISKVKLAMETGQTVVLVNSATINTNFYDVFNRHFAEMISKNEKDETVTSHFANVAVGATSKPCYVHPQFQIIVHMPQSEFEAAPLPFLNRFEKYILGYKELLNDKLNQMKSQRKNNHLMYQQYELFRGLKRGVKHFVETFSKSSFYGFVQSETINSLMYQILSNTDIHSAPNIPQPMRIQGALIDLPSRLEEAKSDETSAYSHLQRLPEFIRRFNYLLLQIARPESMYLRKAILPRAYMEEYLTRQEHLSAKHFLNNLLDQHFSKENTSIGKWMLFTRSSSNIYQLLNSPTAKNLLLETLRRNDKLPADSEFDTEYTLNIASLSNVSNQTECDSIVKKFLKSERQSILIFTVDMRTVSKSQLNYLRYVIDNQSAKVDLAKKQGYLSYLNKQPLICCIVHFPPEFIQLKPTYDSVFNDWNFVYIDSFDFEQKGLMTETTQTSKSYDPRFWLGVAIGYTDYFQSSMDFMSEFKALYAKAVAATVMKLPSKPTALIHPHRKVIIEKILENTAIGVVILKDFSQNWSRDKLSAFTLSACRSVAEGTSIQSILELIYSKLEFTLVDKVETYIEQIAYQVDTLKGLSDRQCDPSLLKAILECIPAPNACNYICLEKEALPFSSIFLRKVMHTPDEAQIGSLTSVEQYFQSKFQGVVRQAVDIIQDKQQTDLLFTDLIRAAFNTRRNEKLQTFIETILRLKCMTIGLDLSQISSLLAIQVVHNNFVKVLLFFFTKLPHRLEDRESMERVFTSCRNQEEIIDRLYMSSLRNLWEKLGKGNLKKWISKFERIDYNYISVKADKSTHNFYKCCFIYYSYVKHFSEEWESIKTDKNPSDHQNALTNQTEIIESIVKSRGNRQIDPVNGKRWLVETMLILFNQIRGMKQEEMVTLLRLINTNEGIWALWPVAAKAQLVQSLFNSRRNCSYMIENLIDEELRRTLVDESIQTPEIDVGEEISSGMLEQLLLRAMLSELAESDFEHLYEEYLEIAEQHASRFNRLFIYAYEVSLISSLAKLCCSDSPTKALQELTEKQTKVVCTLMNENKKIQLFFLSQVRPNNHLSNLLRLDNDAKLRAIGLSNWAMEDIEITNSTSYHFSFMYDESNQGNAYRSMINLFKATNLENLKAYVLQEPNTYQTRMFLLLVCFNEYFLECNPCPILDNLLQDQAIVNHLHVTGEEMKAYQFYSRGPHDEPEERHHLDKYVTYHFSKQHLQSNASKEATYLLTNIAAVCLGVPKNKNHMYNRMFHPEVLHDSFSPGSTYNHVSWDCGFQTDGLQIIYFSEYARNILNGNQMYHSALNTLTWGAFALCMLFDPQRNCKLSKDNHMLNYVGRDGHGDRNLSEIDMVSKYIFTRFVSFLSLVSISHAISSQNIDLTVFFTYSLMHFFNHAPTSDKAMGYWAMNGDLAPQIRAYENFIRDQCFQPVIDGYGQIREAIQRGSRNNQKLRELFEHQNILITKQDQFNYFPKLTAALEDLTRIDPQKVPTITLYNQLEQKLKALQQLPVLIEFYIVLHSKLNKKLKKGDELSMTGIQAVQYCGGECVNLWRSFQTAWNSCKEQLGQLQVCHFAEENGEASIIDMNDDVPLLSLLKTENNEILRMIESLITTTQEKVTEQSETLETLECGLIPQMDLALCSSLLASPQDNLELYANSSCFIDDNGRIFDWILIDELFKFRFMLGPVKLSTSALNGIDFKYQNLNPESEIAEPMEDGDNETVALKTLHQLIERMKYYHCQDLSTMSNSTKNMLNKHIGRPQKRYHMIDELNRLMIHIRTEAQELVEINFSATLIHYGQSKQIDIPELSKFKFMTVVQLAHIVDLSEHVFNYSLTQSLPTDNFSSLNTALSAETQHHLNKFEQETLKCLDNEPNDEPVDFIRELTNIFVSNSDKLATCTQQKTRLSELFKDELSGFNAEMLHAVLPNTVYVENYGEFMKFARLLCGKYDFKKSMMPQAVYKEMTKLDKSVGEMTLEGNEPITEPEDQSNNPVIETTQEATSYAMIYEEDSSVMYFDKVLSHSRNEEVRQLMNSTANLEAEVKQLREQHKLMIDDIHSMELLITDLTMFEEDIDRLTKLDKLVDSMIYQ